MYMYVYLHATCKKPHHACYVHVFDVQVYGCTYLEGISLGKVSQNVLVYTYRSVPGKCPCTAFQGVNVTASIQTYGNYITMHIIHVHVGYMYMMDRDH